jgi:hypothetical protein
VPTLRVGHVRESHGKNCDCNGQKGSSAHAATISCHF